MTRLAIFAALALTACPPSQPPAPVPPDATDGAPMPVQDAAAPPGPTTPCEAACAALARLCGPQLDDCVQVMSQIDGQRILRETVSGKPLTCADVAAATSKTAMRALGVVCP